MLLDELYAGHGGDPAWRERRQVRARASARGLMFASKRASRWYRDFEVTVDTERPRAVLDRYPRAGRRGIFEGDYVRIEAADGEVLAERSDPRAAFRPLSRRALWWDPLDALYFMGYAWWNYLTTPVLLRRPEVEVREGQPWEEGSGERWRRLEVTFPHGFPTHSREQTFYLDDEGRVRRHDYTAEIYGSWARGAHYSWQHREIDGAIFPTRRRVVPRLPSNRAWPGPTVVSAELSPAR